MGFTNLPSINKRSIVYNMSRGDREREKFLDMLSEKELMILKNHSDLMDKILQISKLSHDQLLTKLKEEYGLEIDAYPSNDLWIGTEKLEEALPSWFESSHCGWFKKPGDFKAWACEFLMQEVRINLWIRYLEHKKTFKATRLFGTYV